MVRHQQGLERGKKKRAAVMQAQELRMITQLLRTVTVHLLLQSLQELRRNTGHLARENKALTTDSHSKEWKLEAHRAAEGTVGVRETALRHVLGSALDPQQECTAPV